MQEGRVVFTHKGKGKENKMWGLPDSAVYGTYKIIKSRAKKSAKKRAKVVKVSQRPTALHKQRSVAELLELSRHAK